MKIKHDCGFGSSNQAKEVRQNVTAVMPVFDDYPVEKRVTLEPTIQRAYELDDFLRENGFYILIEGFDSPNIVHIRITGPRDVYPEG